MSNHLKRQLNAMKESDWSNANPEWVAKNRANLFARIQQSTELVEKVSWLMKIKMALRMVFPRQVLVFARSAAIIFLGGSVAVSGWIASVSASYNSLPGEALYQVKLANESGELLAASVMGQEQKVKTLLKHATTRVEEYKNSKSSDQAVQAIKSLKKTLVSAGESLHNVETDPNGNVSAVAKAVDEKTESFLHTLTTNSEAQANLSTTTDSQAGELVKAVDEAKDLIESTGSKAVEVLIEKKISGDETVNLNDVIDKVEKKLERVVTDFAAIHADTVSSTATGTLGIKINLPMLVTGTDSNLNSSTGTPLVTVSGTLGLINPLSFVPNTGVVVDIRNTEEKLKDTTKIVADGVAEAKVLISNNDITSLLGALKKVQELNDVKKETKTVVDAANKIISDAVIASQIAPTVPLTAPSTTVSTTPTVSGTISTKATTSIKNITP